MYYDEDYGDPRQYCRHGSFIGSWWGPDYLCGQCESNEDDPSLNDMIRGIFDQIHEQTIRKSAHNEMFLEMNKMNKVSEEHVQAYLYLLDIVEDRIKSLMNQKDELIDMYAPFCDEDGYDDHGILYKYHRWALEEYDKMKEEMQ
jgi:hypothetical protein